MSETKTLKSLDDLRRLREEAHRDIRCGKPLAPRSSSAWAPAGSPAGAREVMRAVLAELDKENIEAHVTTVGCIGMCALEPLLDIVQAGGARITYGKVTPERVPRIISEHILRGQPVEEWVVGRTTSFG